MTTTAASPTPEHGHKEVVQQAPQSTGTQGTDETQEPPVPAPLVPAPPTGVPASTGRPPAPIAHVRVDKSAIDPHVVVRRARERENAQHAATEREKILTGIVPFMPVTTVMDIPKSLRDKVAEAFEHTNGVKFNIVESEPAARAGVHLNGHVNEDLAGADASRLLDPFPVVPEQIEVVDDDGTRHMVTLSPDERYRRLVEVVFKRAFEQEGQSLADLLPMRVRVAWRITREMARIRGLAMSDEPLSSALLGTGANPDPWQVPEVWQEPAAREARLNLYPEVIDAIRASECLEESLAVHLWVATDPYKPDEGAERRRYEGLGLLPPPVPPRWRSDQGEISREYIPEKDPALGLFISIASDIAERLTIPTGSRFDSDQGRLGLLGLLDSTLIRLCWPSRTQILAWEAMMVEETLDLVVKTSISETKRTLKDKYGLIPREILGLLRMASSLASDQTSGDREESRSIMVLRLEEYLRRSRDALDLRAEMQGLKQLSIVLGLGDANFNDPMLEFLNAVRQVGAERNRDRPRRRVENETQPPTLPA